MIGVWTYHQLAVVIKMVNYIYFNLICASVSTPFVFNWKVPSQLKYRSLSASLFTLCLGNVCLFIRLVGGGGFHPSNHKRFTKCYRSIQRDQLPSWRPLQMFKTN